ncbi:MAG: hypothetical protein LLG13_12850 [Bacteroidales bacterium]|nr:hypothetical protein [Bacteroidales bacterium]
MKVTKKTTTKMMSFEEFQEHKKMLDYVIKDIEKRIDKLLNMPDTENEAFDLFVLLDLSKNKKLDKRFKGSLADIYEYFIIKNPHKLISVFRKLLQAEQFVYEIDLIRTEDLIFLLNRSIEKYFDNKLSNSKKAIVKNKMGQIKQTLLLILRNFIKSVQNQ